MPTRVHKENASASPLVSLILLDWSVRERFHAFDWLARQDVPREQFETIWIELYDRVVPVAMDKADVVITCDQKGLYEKHAAYNVGLLHAKGQLVTVCDSDAVFPPDFISSILRSFGLAQSSEARPLVLMHHEKRTPHTYPDGLSDLADLARHPWEPIRPNLGACMTVRRADAIRFGGFDEHPSFRGYLCGPYDLGWRLVNAGIPEVWHDETVTLWHFNHPDPVSSFSQPFSMERWSQVSYPHVDHWALMAVEAFSTGRQLPLKESPQVFKLRMSLRQIGTEFEKKYAWLTGPSGFSKWQKFKLHLRLKLEPLILIRYFLVMHFLIVLKRVIGEKRYGRLRAWWHSG
ncbi:MAG: glycosyltransferase [Planctomycetes bacterium]|nr:glycosyltransferase [Planctomycetota bacterium]